jgi:UDP-N-acetylmuramoyl-tripeptide--D-alanyl-D-alanine ligase
MPIDRFYLIGPFAKSMADIIGAHAFVKSSKADIARALKDDIKGVSVVLLKGSRSAAMEEVANLLQEVEK